MTNITISDLPPATLPLSLADTVLEVQTVEGGVPVSRKVTGDNIMFGLAGAYQGLGPWTYEASGAAPPATGELRFDNADPALATEIYISETNGNAADLSGFLALIGSGALVYIQDKTTEDNFIVLQVNSFTDSGTYVTLGIAQIVQQGGTIADGSNLIVMATVGGSSFPTAANVGDMLRASVLPDTYAATHAINVGAAVTPATNTLSIPGDGQVVITHASFPLLQVSIASGLTNGAWLFGGAASGQLNFSGDRVGAKFFTFGVYTGTIDRALIELSGSGGVTLNHTSDGSDRIVTQQTGSRFDGDITAEAVWDFRGANNHGMRLYLVDPVVQNFGIELDVPGPGTEAFLRQMGGSAGNPVEQDAWIRMVQNGLVEQRHNDIAITQTDSTGFIILPLAAAATNLYINATAAQNAVIQLQENSVEQVRILHDATANQLRFRMANAGDTIQFEEGAGTNIAMTLTPNGQQAIRHANVSVIQTLAAASGGAQVNNTLTGAGFERVLTASDLGVVSFPVDALDNEQIRWGTGQDVLQFFDGSNMHFTAAASLEFRFNGAAATTARVRINAVTGQDAILRFSENVTTRWDLFYDASTTRARSEMANAAGIFEIATAGGNCAVFTGGGSVQLLHNFVSMVVTTTAAAGGLTVNNTLTGTGFERVLTASDGYTLRIILTAQASATSTTTLATLTGFSVTLAGSTRYRFRAVLWAANASVAGINPGLRLRADYSGTQSNLEGMIVIHQSGALRNADRALPDSTITDLYVGTTADEAMVVYEGFIETVTTGTLALQFAQATADANATVIEEGSSFEVWPD